MLSCNTAQFRSSHVCVHGFESDSEILCDNFLVKELDVEAKYFSLSICPRLATISPFFLAKDECFAPPTHQPRVSKRSWKKFHFRLRGSSAMTLQRFLHSLTTGYTAYLDKSARRQMTVKRDKSLTKMRLQMCIQKNFSKAWKGSNRLM